jgi:hypothetical protein
LTRLLRPWRNSGSFVTAFAHALQRRGAVDGDSDLLGEKAKMVPPALDHFPPLLREELMKSFRDSVWLFGLGNWRRTDIKLMGALGEVLVSEKDTKALLVVVNR